MLALIKDQGIVTTVSEGGWVDLGNGSFISPAEAGWSDEDGYSLAAVQAADEVPAGKRAVNVRVEMVQGVPKFVFDVEDVPVPASVSARQFKLQLLSNGLLDQVEAFVAAQGQAVQIAYDNSGTFVRSEPMMQAGFAALGFADEQVDAFFVAASKL
ncbi:hypothetical protein [Mesorhizobium sp. CA4]|uniref:hypothetical protein n=1 Tax=Mesorhizobium sp. CA4 TaxID=588499 RepID=UPI001CD0AB11|nr:hypothetical protein [Mesorhizobium sp. CA4]MBZ9822348.1 hypothetical protein [Mesorhizobium sp. CA4]